MSASFGSASLFGAGAGNNPSANADTSFALRPGLRQRRPPAAADVRADENANPNRSSLRDGGGASYGKWGSMSKVPAPPRVFLANAGNAAFRGTTAAATTAQPRQPRQRPAENRDGTHVDSNRNDAAQRNEQGETEDLSLWVVGYGYRNEAHFRALYRLLERCGTITARRGGLSRPGEGGGRDDDDDDGGNWVAVRYDSALCAQKALCHDRSLVSVGGSTMVASVMPLGGSDAAARLGIDVRGGPSRRAVALELEGPRDDGDQSLRTEEDVTPCEEMEEGKKSGLDGFCGKVLAWFFMWETQN